MREQGLGARTGGVWTAADARRAGIGPDAVVHACRTGTWQTVRRGVYADGGVELGAQQRAWAAVLAGGGPGRAWAAGRTAARLHGLPLVDDDDPATGRQERRHDDVGVRRAVAERATLHPHRWSVPPGELGTLHGCPVPSVLATLWHLRLVLRPDALVCVLDSALHAERVTRERLDVLGATSARGARGFRQAVTLTDGRAESPLETLSRLVLRPVLPDLEPQVSVRSTAGRELARIDLGVAAARWGVEADGASHRGPVSLAKDRARERLTGWTLERVTWAEVRCAPDALRERVALSAAASGVQVVRPGAEGAGGGPRARAS